MDYPYENLGPEKFQLFCQALLVKEHPDLQCFPVGQPDGGRDASQLWFRGNNGFVMFQVKFIRQPQAENDPHKRILDIVGEELPKVKKQIERGAKRYVLMTNVAGTSHLDVGTIDTVNTMMTKELGIPSVCLWRNDLNRRLDVAWDLKWVYPELMTGPDLIRFIIEGGLSEDRERRAATVRAFVAHQSGLDEEVRFKQVDLQNRLLDLFIDMPLCHRDRSGFMFAEDYYVNHERPWSLFAQDFDEELIVDPKTLSPRFARHKQHGAASTILSSKSQRRMPFLVLEGAPGQGKSTITQYVCQVHRMRLLNHVQELALVCEEDRMSPVKLPFKVDLRDFAVWLTRRNPFTAEGEEIPLNAWVKSLEAFLATLVQYQSGGAPFNVSDLHAVFRLSAVLLVLDGLDEVADIGRRGEVVAEITKGVDRLKTLAASLQVVVTSRPTAFANSPGLSEQAFRYLSLDSVTQELIEEYASKWIKARHLQPRESSGVKRILREKLDQPHMRDLARNPMQLAILLSLIHTQGSSLPDKRTALYDSYVRLFFNREAEKSEIVRDNRELLMDIHRYLAWLLHSEAEQVSGDVFVRSNGAIEERRLKQILCEYLKSDGHDDPDLPDKLFTGVVERVVALVSRVQGTYEFEVQPLREYFAARFLYDTAPYSPVGGEKRGTKPDRFDAISRNFYWLNVTRFYAGCYSKGELASLIDGLRDLTVDKDFHMLSHPRVLAATLLGDWVFTQHPKSVAEVIRLILDGIGLRFLLVSNSRRLSRSQPLVLPTACGRTELVNKCIEMLKNNPTPDYALDVVDLLRANTTRDEIVPLWLSEICRVKGKARSNWFRYGLHLGCVSTVSRTDLDELLKDECLNRERVDILLRAGRAEVVEESSDYFSFAVDAVLDCGMTVGFGGREQRLIEVFSQSLDPTRYALAFGETDKEPLKEKWRKLRRRSMAEINLTYEGIKENPSALICHQIITVALELSNREACWWATELTPWETLVNAIVERFGVRWIAMHLSNIGSGIRSATDTCTDSSDLFDSSKSLCRRARYARLRAGNPRWWRNTLEEATNRERHLFACMLLFTWASPSTIMHCISLADEIVVKIEEDEWQAIYDSVENATDLTRNQPGYRLMDLSRENIPDSLSPRTLALLRLRMKPSATEDAIRIGLKQYKGTDIRILKICQADAIERMLHSSPDWDLTLEIITRAYTSGVISTRFAPAEFARRGSFQSIPVEIATRITTNADRFPSFLVAAAEACCREYITKCIRPVTKVAEEQKWFLPA